MIILIPLDDSETELPSGRYLAAKWVPGDGRSGATTWRLLDASFDERAKARLNLDPAKPEGFEVCEWLRADALLLTSADRIVVLSLERMTIEASIPLEYGECRIAGPPWFHLQDDYAIVATENRVFCIDTRLAVRWVWTVRVYSEEWWTISEAPRVQGSEVRVALTHIERDAEVRLSLSEGMMVT